jgi:hypothetical protein
MRIENEAQVRLKLPYFFRVKYTDGSEERDQNKELKSEINRWI